MGAVIELLPTVEQPVAAAPFAATNLILQAAEALGRLARVESIAAGKSIEEARICGHAVTVSRLALALDELVTNQQALVEALQKARKCISIDRSEMADSHMDPVTDTVDDEDVLAALAEYDQTIQHIDGALARVNGGVQ